MSVEIIADQWVCVDCLMVIANGDYPDDPERAAEVEAGEKRELPYQWVCESPHTGEHAPECRSCDGTGKDEYADDGVCAKCEGRGKIDEDEEADTQTFSWSECDCCQSSLGGSRHRCALIKHDEAK